MNLSILIVNWNTRALLDQCLQTILTYPPAAEYEIWVVDNASTDGSLDLLRERYPAVRVIANTDNIGFARANNQAMQAAQGQAFLLLNSDTLVQPGALDALLRALADNPRAGVVGSKLLNADGSLQESWAAFPNLFSELLGRNIRRRTPVTGKPGLYRVDWVGGACLLARAGAVRQVGRLDEGYFMYSEEVDWCYRMRQAGWQTLYLESAAVIHLGGGSASRTNLNQLVRLYDSKLRFFNKHYGPWQASCLRAGLILAHLMRLAGRGLALLLHRPRSNQLPGRIQAQWQLIRWLFDGGLS